MSTVLYVAGALAFLAGLVAIGFGSPASALDFGNTLIVAGTTAAVGGLITIALAAVTARLQHLTELMSAPLPPEHTETAPSPPSPPPPRFEPKPAPDAKPAPFEPRGPSTPPEFPAFGGAPPPMPIAGMAASA